MYKVLIVDDEKYICQLISRLVDWESMGLSVIGMANNSDDALRLSRIEAPDIIITDISMPDTDGLTFIENIKKELTDVSVIFVSGYRDFKYVHKALLLDAADYLLKPIKKNELISVLSKTIKNKDEKSMEKAEQKAVEAQVLELKGTLHAAFVRDAVLTLKLSGDTDVSQINQKYKL